MNVLIFITDQQRAGTIGPHTPNLAKLATQSICFNAFAQSPQCQPSRAAFWTGRYPSSFGLWWNEMPLLRTERTLANILRDKKYSTAYFGKWHLDENSSTLEHFGFDPDDSYLMEDWQRGDGMPIREAGVARREFLKIMKTRSWAAKLSSRLYQHEDMISERAVRFMGRSDGPFLCAVGFRGPHPPYTSPPPYCNIYDPSSFSAPSDVTTYDGKKLTIDDWRLIKSQYYGNILWLDDNIGRILDYVDRKIPDTIVVFTSDHGDMLGDHGKFSKGLYAYDEIVSVPLMIRAPKFVPGQNNGLTQLIDVTPTILELLGYDIPQNIEGKSLVGGSVNSFVFSMMGVEPRLRMVRDRRFKYWDYDGFEFLFDLDKDPGEVVNVAGAMPEKCSFFRDKLI